MRRLWDRRTVRRLRAAVRRMSPADWSEGRALRRALRRGQPGWLSSLTPLVGIFPFCWLVESPLMQDKQINIDHPAAIGVVTLYFLAAGTALGAMLTTEGKVEIHPLAYAPVDGGFVYRHALSVLRWQAVRRALLGLFTLWVGACGVAIFAPGPSTSFPPLKAFVGTLLFAGPCCLLGTLRVFPWRLVTQVILCVFAAAAFSFLLFILHLKFSFVPLPTVIGHAMLVLPQSEVFGWLAGGPISWFPVFFSLGCTMLMLQLLLDRYRDRQHEIELESDDARPTAEYMAAQVLQKWREKTGEAAPEVDPLWFEDEKDETNEPAGEDEEEGSLPLLLHPAAPAEHATPVSAEFRQAVAERLRLRLNQTGAAEITAPFLSSPRLRFPPLAQPLRKVAVWGVVLPLLCLLPPCLPASVRAWLGDSWRVAVFILLVVPVAFRTGLPLNLPALQRRGYRPAFIPWACLPLDLHAQAAFFKAWSRRSLLRRLQLAAAAVASVAATTFLFLTCSRWLGFEIALHRIEFLGSGLGWWAVPGVAVVLVVEILLRRGFEVVGFTINLLKEMQMRRLWRLATGMRWILTLLVFCIWLALLITLLSSVSIDWRGGVWMWAFPELLAGELMLEAILRFALFLAKNARADFPP